jgi:hypothetical protein
MDVRSRKAVSAVFGALLLAAGSLLLLESPGVVASPGLFWGGLFLVAAVVFWYLFSIGRQEWWAAIPGGALLGLGVVVLTDEAGVPGSGRGDGASPMGVDPGRRACGAGRAGGHGTAGRARLPVAAGPARRRRVPAPAGRRPAPRGGAGSSGHRRTIVVGRTRARLNPHRSDGPLATLR